MNTPDIETGRKLRKLGWHLDDIALYLGCTVEWCRYNLGDVKKDAAVTEKVVEWQATKHRDPKSKEKMLSLMSELDD